MFRDISSYEKIIWEIFNNRLIFIAFDCLKYYNHYLNEDYILKEIMILLFLFTGQQSVKQRISMVVVERKSRKKKQKKKNSSGSVVISTAKSKMEIIYFFFKL